MAVCLGTTGARDGTRRKSEMKMEMKGGRWRRDRMDEKKGGRSLTEIERDKR